MKEALWRKILKAVLIVIVVACTVAAAYVHTIPVVGDTNWNVDVRADINDTVVERGDLIFWQSDSTVSALLSHCLRNPFTHMSMVWHGGPISKCHVIDCDVFEEKAGVNVWPFIKKLAAWPGDYVAVMRKKRVLTDTELDKLYVAADACLHKVKGFMMSSVYAFNSMFLKKAWIHNKYKDSSKYFCCEFMTVMLKHACVLDKTIPRSLLDTNDYWFRKKTGLAELYDEPVVFDSTPILMGDVPVSLLITESLKKPPNTTDKSTNRARNVTGVVPHEPLGIVTNKPTSSTT